MIPFMEEPGQCVLRTLLPPLLLLLPPQLLLLLLLLPPAAVHQCSSLLPI
jgi:hypothetical protein